MSPPPSAAATRQVLRTVWTQPANRGARARALARTLRFQGRARLLGRPTVVSYGRRSRFLARLDDAPSRRAAYAATPDHPEMTVWRARLRPGDLFVDVGASVGLYTVMAAELGCEVVAVEPQRRSREQLRANLGLNGYLAQVLDVALAAEAGMAAMVGPDASRAHLTSASGGGAEPVQVTTLDAVLGDRRAQGVKIDVEGAERLVLAGAPRALAEGRIELLQLEWNHQSERNFGESRAPLAELLHAAGYELTRPDGEGRLHRIDDLGPGADVFARPVDRR